MKNTNVKESLVESDLEEGEIPEFEIGLNTNPPTLNSKYEERNQPIKKIYPGSAPDFGWEKDSPAVRIQNPSQGFLLKNSIYFSSDKGRYELTSAENEYGSEKSKSVMRNQVPQDTFYDYNTAERRLKYLHPFQATYGSVEHIMSKIGETLGRSNDCYYKGRRPNDPRGLIKFSNNVGTTFRESGSLFRRFRNTYHKKRRYSDSNSDSDRDIWEASGKLRNRSSVDIRRKEEKDFRKKRKPKCNSASATDGDTKKIRLPGKSDAAGDDLNAESVKPTFAGNERLLKAIRELQERENETGDGHEAPFTEQGSNVIPQFPSSFGSDKDAENPAVVSCGTINSDENQETRNYDDLSEKSSVNGEDSDDDVELIKLRLLALTSNKRKTQELAGEKVKDTKQKLLEKTEVTDDEKEAENLPGPNDMIDCENKYYNDIDRYELLLRAEALKTALLKKHKHRIKKRRYSSCSISVGLDDRDEKLEGPENKGNEIIRSDVTERETRNKEGSFSAEGDTCVNANAVPVTIPVTKNETNSESHTNSERTVKLEKLLLGAKSPDFVNTSKEYVPLDENPDQIGETDDKEISQMKGFNQTRKKLKRKRLKKNRKFGGLKLNEISIKENSGMSNMTPDEGDNKMKALLPDSINQKKALKEHEKKFILVDSSQLSKLPSNCGSKLSSELEQGDKSTVSSKDDVVISATTTAKLPESEIQRIIIHLGSDSSEEEFPIQNQPKSDAGSSTIPENVEPSSTATGGAYSKIVDYEKSVELLLKDARRRIEQKMETPQKVPPTPEAVYNHLAPSQRLEYVRLKQKIAETEKLRRIKEKTCLSSASEESLRKNQLKNVKNRVCPTTEIQRKDLSYDKMSSGIKSLFLRSNIRDTAAITNKSSIVSSNNINNNRKNKNKNCARITLNKVNNDGINSVMKLQREGNIRSINIINDSANLGKKILPKDGSASNSVSVVKNILERKKTLTQNRLHLERLKILWKNIKMEKMIQDKCMNELKRLKIQQNFFELKVSQQRTKIKKLAEESKQIYEAFQKMNKGLEISGKKKKMFVTEKNSPETVENKVAGTNDGEKCFRIETVSNIDVVPAPGNNEGNLVDKIDGIINLEDKDHQSAKSSEPALSGCQGEQLKEYNSPLQRHATGSESSSCQKVDPNTIMCEYDLTGKCNDEECPYQHLRC